MECIVKKLANGAAIKRAYSIASCPGAARYEFFVRLVEGGALTPKLFALPHKGRLQAGADADLTIVDLGATWRYDSAGALTKSRANMRIYDGVEMHGRVVSTVVRGAVVYQDGVVTGSPGHGQFVRPEPA